MANKKYNQFPTGTPAGTDIVLFGDPTTGALEKTTVTDLLATGGGSASYLVYTALLTQSGTDAPVATVLENTLGGTVVWSYLGVGQFRATLASAFPVNKTVCPGFPDTADNTRRAQFNRDGDDVFIGASLASTSEVELSVSDVTLTPSNGQISSFFFEIRVYP